MIDPITLLNDALERVRYRPGTNEYNRLLGLVSRFLLLSPRAQEQAILYGERWTEGLKKFYNLNDDELKPQFRPPRLDK